MGGTSISWRVAFVRRLVLLSPPSGGVSAFGWVCLRVGEGTVVWGVVRLARCWVLREWLLAAVLWGLHGR